MIDPTPLYVLASLVVGFGLGAWAGHARARDVDEASIRHAEERKRLDRERSRILDAQFARTAAEASTLERDREINERPIAQPPPEPAWKSIPIVKNWTAGPVVFKPERGVVQLFGPGRHGDMGVEREVQVTAEGRPIPVTITPDNPA